MVGDKVLLRHTAFKGKHKIQDQWKNTVYELIRLLSLFVYIMNKTGIAVNKVKTLLKS